MHHVIEADHMVKRIAGTTILDSLSFTVSAGTVLGVLGPNGAGKTTAVKSVTGLLRLDSGSVRVLGHDVRHDGDAVKQQLGLAGQYAAVDGDLTALENLMLVARLYGMSIRAAKARARELVDAFDMSTYAAKQVQQYSGGMRRRVDLACALIARPQVLVLDEPTTGLDPASRRALWLMIETLVNDGMTLLLATQYLEEADRLADRILVINAGRSIAEGTPSELKTRLGADRVRITLATPATQQHPALAALASAGSKDAQFDPETGQIEARLTTRTALSQIVTSLSHAEIDIAALSVHEPTLDDVFFALTETATPTYDTTKVV